MKRIPSLDGLRAASILIVLVGHLDGTRGFGSPPSVFGDPAHLGVRVFFVISGYLITTLLLEEVGRHGRIDLKGFYLRRVYRIFPAFYTFIAIVLVARALGLVDVSLADIGLAATYTINYSPGRAWVVGHLWSLAVEEQFYLLWPATLVLAGARRGLWAAGAVIVLAPIVRIGWFYFARDRLALVGEAFPTVADSIATGCVLASMRPWLEARPPYLRFLRSPAVWLVLALALAVNSREKSVRLHWLVGETIVNVCIAVILHRVIVRPETWSGRVLNFKPLAYVGVLSYSIYLWQQPFLNRESSSWWCAFPQNLACVAVAALASYHLVEKPFLKLRHRAPPAPARAEPKLTP